MILSVIISDYDGIFLGHIGTKIVPTRHITNHLIVCYVWCYIFLPVGSIFYMSSRIRFRNCFLNEWIEYVWCTIISWIPVLYSAHYMNLPILFILFVCVLNFTIMLGKKLAYEDISISLKMWLNSVPERGVIVIFNLNSIS